FGAAPIAGTRAGGEQRCSHEGNRTGGQRVGSTTPRRSIANLHFQRARVRLCGAARRDPVTGWRRSSHSGGARDDREHQPRLRDRAQLRIEPEALVQPEGELPALLSCCAGAGRGEPRAVLKFGAFHAERGLNGVRQYDVGWLAAALAEMNGSRSFHVLVMGGPDTQRAQFDVMSLAYRPQPVEMIAEEWMQAPRAALLESGYTVYDLRPIRALIQDRKLRNVPAPLERAIFGFDVMVVLTGSRPALEESAQP